MVNLIQSNLITKNHNNRSFSTATTPPPSSSNPLLTARNNEQIEQRVERIQKYLAQLHTIPNPTSLGNPLDPENQKKFPIVCKVLSNLNDLERLSWENLNTISDLDTTMAQAELEVKKNLHSLPSPKIEDINNEFLKKLEHLINQCDQEVLQQLNPASENYNPLHFHTETSKKLTYIYRKWRSFSACTDNTNQPFLWKTYPLIHQLESRYSYLNYISSLVHGILAYSDTSSVEKTQIKIRVCSSKLPEFNRLVANQYQILAALKWNTEKEIIKSLQEIKSCMSLYFHFPVDHESLFKSITPIMKEAVCRAAKNGLPSLYADIESLAKEIEEKLDGFSRIKTQFLQIQDSSNNYDELWRLEREWLEIRRSCIALNIQPSQAEPYLTRKPRQKRAPENSDADPTTCPPRYRTRSVSKAMESSRTLHLKKN